MSTDEPEQITIDVADAGARLTGTSKGSPASEIVRQAGRPWTWGRRAGAWVLPRSLRHETVDYRVESMVALLEAAGHTVTVTGAEDRETDEEREARRLDRDRQLVDVHEHRADRSDAEADAAHADMKQIADMIPFGQPVLVDHHSAPRHRRDLDKMNRKMGKAVEGWREAEHERGLAVAAAARVARADAAALVATIGQADARRGDYINTRYGWKIVIRSSPKSATISPPLVGPSWYNGHLCTDRIPWVKVTEVRRNDDPAAALDAFTRAAQDADGYADVTPET